MEEFDQRWTDLAAYPYCEADEVRELLYNVRDTQDIPNSDYIDYYRDGPVVRVGRDPTTKNPSLNANIIDAVNTLFICRLPDFTRVQIEAQNADIPPSLKCEVERMTATLSDSKYPSPCYEWVPVEVSGEYSSGGWDGVQATLRRTQLTMRAVQDAEKGTMHHCTINVHNDGPLTYTLDWIPAYDTMLLSAWHDELKAANVSISFRPRWSLFPANNAMSELEWPVIVPDVVFSARVPLSSARLIAARRYHPGYAFADSDVARSQNDVLEIPLLVVEYDKAPHKAEASTHEFHLKSAMAAALPLHAALGLQIPLAGLYIKHFDVETYLGTVRDRNGHSQPSIHQVFLQWPFRSLNLMTEPRLHIWHVRSMVSNLGEIATRIVQESMQCPADTALRICSWPYQPNMEPPDIITSRPPIDGQHPPLVATDVVLNFLFASEVAFIEQWLEKADVIVAAESQRSVVLPTRVKEWLQLFEGSREIDHARLLEIIEDTKKAIPDEAYNLIDPFLSAYQASSAVAGVQSHSSSDMSFSLTFSLYARELFDAPVSSLDRHSHTTHWMSLYASLFSRAWQVAESGLILQQCPQWQVHHCLRRTDEETASLRRVPLLEEMRPNFAFLLALPGDSLILPLREWPEDIQDAVMFDFAVTTHFTDATAIDRAQVPLLIVEYVLLPEERFKHLAHLSMALRSALAIWEIHCVEAPVIGLLVDQNIVTTVMGWIDDGQCMIQEVSDYRFDVFDPYDAFRLYELVKAQGSKELRAQIRRMIDEHKEEALRRLSDVHYCSWKLAADRVPSSELYNDSKSVGDWTEGLQ